jgi:mechanosensitive ion channel-like protein
MIDFATILDQAGDSLGGFLPRLAGALLLLVVGVIAARVISRLAARGLGRAGLDRFAENWGVSNVLSRAGLGSSLADVVGRALRIALTLIAIFAALSLLGLQFLSESLNAAVLLLPKLLVAAALLLAGVVLGSYVREWVDRFSFQMGLPGPLGGLAQAAVVAIFAISAAAQVAVSTALLVVLIAILVAAAAGMIALAFGLGGRDVARELSAARTLRSIYTSGQRISFAATEGTVKEVANAITIIETASGSVHVPNSLLLGSVVVVADQPEEGTPSTPA